MYPMMRFAFMGKPQPIVFDDIFRGSIDFKLSFHFAEKQSQQATLKLWEARFQAGRGRGRVRMSARVASTAVMKYTTVSPHSQR